MQFGYAMAEAFKSAPFWLQNFTTIISYALAINCASEIDFILSHQVFWPLCWSAICALTLNRSNFFAGGVTLGNVPFR